MKATFRLLLPQKVANGEQVAPLQYSLSDTARMLGYGRRMIDRLIAQGELATVGRGRLRRVPLSEIIAFQERNRSEAA